MHAKRPLFRVFAFDESAENRNGVAIVELAEVDRRTGPCIRVRAFKLKFQ